MAAPIQPCPCSPYETICCCGPENGVSMVQPVCQTIPDGRVVNNPAYDSQLDRSFWTYKFLTDCAQETRGISNFVIPICEVLQPAHVIVREKIDGCGDFELVPFTLSEFDPNFGQAPDGFQWLKVEVDDRYEKGVSVVYLLELTGNFTPTIQPAQVKAHDSIFIFDCSGCVLVPECSPQGSLVLDKDCSVTISNNQATFNYLVEVNNIGNAALPNVQYLDEVIVPSVLSIGTITVTPGTLNVAVAPGGLVTISGNLGTIPPGGQVLISYSIPITGVTVPGTYLIDNTAFASAAGTESTASCIVPLDVVQVEIDKCCSVTDGNKLAFRIHLRNLSNSPATEVDILDNIMIPPGVTVRFHSFDGCNATIAGTTNPVEINTNIVGPASININCNGLSLPAGNIIQKLITLTVVSTSVPGTTIIANTINAIDLTASDEQILLGVGDLPFTVLTEVTFNVSCRTPC